MSISKKKNEFLRQIKYSLRHDNTLEVQSNIEVFLSDLRRLYRKDKTSFNPDDIRYLKNLAAFQDALDVAADVESFLKGASRCRLLSQSMDEQLETLPRAVSEGDEYKDLVDYFDRLRNDLELFCLHFEKLEEAEGHSA